MAQQQQQQRTAEPTVQVQQPAAVQPAVTQQAPINEAGTQPAQTVQAAPAGNVERTIMATFERVESNSDKSPYARCSIALQGALAGIQLSGITVWQDAKTKGFNVKLPGQRNFQDLRPATIMVPYNGTEIPADDPAGKVKLGELDTAIYAAFMIWDKVGHKFPGGRVPVTLGT